MSTIYDLSGDVLVYLIRFLDDEVTVARLCLAFKRFYTAVVVQYATIWLKRYGYVKANLYRDTPHEWLEGELYFKYMRCKYHGHKSLAECVLLFGLHQPHVMAELIPNPYVNITLTILTGNLQLVKANQCYTADLMMHVTPKTLLDCMGVTNSNKLFRLVLKLCKNLRRRVDQPFSTMAAEITNCPLITFLHQVEHGQSVSDAMMPLVALLDAPRSYRDVVPMDLLLTCQSVRILSTCNWTQTKFKRDVIARCLSICKFDMGLMDCMIREEQFPSLVSDARLNQISRRNLTRYCLGSRPDLRVNRVVIWLNEILNNTIVGYDYVYQYQLIHKLFKLSLLSDITARQQMQVYLDAYSARNPRGTNFGNIVLKAVRYYLTYSYTPVTPLQAWSVQADTVINTGDTVHILYCALAASTHRVIVTTLDLIINGKTRSSKVPYFILPPHSTYCVTWPPDMSRKVVCFNTGMCDVQWWGIDK